MKCEDVCLKAYEGVPELKRSLREYFMFCNDARPDQRLGYQVREEIDREVLDEQEGAYQDKLVKATG